MLKKLVLCVLLLLTLTGGSYAKPHLHHQHRVVRSVHSVVHTDWQRFHRRLEDGRPHAWCGWFMRRQVPSDPGPAFNLAANWAHFGTAVSGPGVGVIVVWRHHVDLIKGYDEKRKQWITLDGNWHNSVHLGPRSLTGAIAFRRIE